MLPTGYTADPTNVSIAAGDSQEITISFTPTSDSADYDGTITVESNKTSGENTIAVMGAGLTTNTHSSGNLTLSTQAQIDDFNFTEVTGISLTIDEATAGNITNLGGLSILNSIKAGGVVIQTNSELTNVDGLTGLASIGGTLFINSNEALTNVDDLSNLTSNSLSGSLDITNNSKLTNLDGLSGIISVGSSIFIDTNAMLTNLNGLSQITSVGVFFILVLIVIQII